MTCRTSLSQIERAAIEGELNAFDVALGACERITRQAIPLAYTRWGQWVWVLWLHQLHAFLRLLAHTLGPGPGVD